MASSPKKNQARKTELGLRISGVLAATTCFYLLSGSSPYQTEAEAITPDASPVLEQVKRLQKEGDWGKAANLLEAESHEDNPQALLEHAKQLSYGKGVPRDLDMAREKLLLAVRYDFPNRGEAAFELANVYRRSSGEDCARIAFEWFNKAALWGYTKAHAELGKHYLRGIGIPTDTKLALHHYQLASKHGAAHAFLSFIKVLKRKPELGQGLPDIETLVARALPGMEAEALSGSGAAAKTLARLYRDGEFVATNMAQSRLWFRRAAKLNDTGAMTDLALMLLSGTPTESEISEALTHIRNAASQHHGGALTDLGRLHLEGRFNLVRSEAVSLFEQGIEAAHAGAMLEMARLLLTGDMVAPNHVRAVQLLKRGAGLGHKGSIRLLSEVEEGKWEQASISSPNPPVQSRGQTPNRHTTLPAVIVEEQDSRLEIHRVTHSPRPDTTKKRSQSPKQTNPKNRPFTGATTITPFGKKG